MSNDKMREEFEAWALTHFINSKTMNPLQRSGEDPGEYHYPVISTAWTAWQASRESLVIELPAENPIGSGPGDCGDGRPSFEQHCAAECNFMIRDCREAIEAAGVKVKP